MTNTDTIVSYKVTFTSPTGTNLSFTSSGKQECDRYVSELAARYPSYADTIKVTTRIVSTTENTVGAEEFLRDA